MTLSFREFGSLASKQDHQKLVLIHPFPFDGRIWYEVAEKLSTKNYVLVPDLRGCGQSELGKQDPNLDLLALDVIELLISKNLKKVVLAGISLGGYVAMAIARIDPELLAGLILLDTKASNDNEQAMHNRLRIAKQMQEGAKVSLFAKQMLDSVIGSHTQQNNPEVVKRVENWMLDAKPQTIAWLQQAMASRPESFSTLATLNIPTLLIRGMQDSISVKNDFSEMKKNLRQVTYVEISNAGHLPPVEDPNATFNAMEKWLLTFAN